jgi:uncharacterized iron-regulated protein
MENKITALKWILDAFAEKSILSLEDFRQAFLMEKQQIMDAYAQGVADEAGEILDSTKDAEAYFKKTYMD